MHTTIDYGKSPAPAFDAMQDVRDYFRDRYDEVARLMATVTNPYKFSCYCALAGIQGFPVKAWYEHFHGQGSWNEDQYQLAKGICED